MADRLVQQDAGPAGAEYHLHLARRRRHAFQVDQRLTQRLIDRAAPDRGRGDVIVGEATAGAIAAGLAPAILFHHQRDVQPHQRPEVGHAGAIGAHDLHRLPLAGDRGHHLHDTRILAAGIGIDIRQHSGAGREFGRTERIDVGVEPHVGGARRLRGDTGMTRRHRRHAARGTPQGGLGQLAGVCVAGRLAGHGPQAKAQRGVEPGTADPAVIQADLLAFAIFQIKLAVVAAGQRLAERGLGCGAVECRIGTLEK